MKIKFDNQTLLYFVVLILFGVSLLMTTNRSMIIWENIKILSFLQFPWRYLSAVIIFLGLLVGYISVLLPNKYFKYGYVLVLTATILVMNSAYFQPEEFTSDLSEYYYSDANKLRTDMSTTLPDYIPAQITQKEISPVALEGQVLACQTKNNCFDNDEVLENKVHRKVVKVNSHITDRNIIFNIAYFPGWKVKVDNLITPKKVSSDGFIMVAVGSGEHIIEVSFENTPIRKTSNIISIIGLVIFLGMSIWYHKTNDR